MVCVTIEKKGIDPVEVLEKMWDQVFSSSYLRLTDKSMSLKYEPASEPLHNSTQP